MPGKEPCHHWQRGALIPLGPALHWHQQRPVADLASLGSAFWLLKLAEPALLSWILQCILAKPSYYSDPALFQTGNLSQLQAMGERNVFFLKNNVQTSLQASL